LVVAGLEALVVVGLEAAALVEVGLEAAAVVAGLEAAAEGEELPELEPEETPDCQPRLRESSYHQLRSIQPSKSVMVVEEPASMTKLVTPVGVQS
jgi:hypothetical protein